MSLVYKENYSQTENVYQIDKCGWTYQFCECCPYGYHIDLDFVRFCEAINDQGTRTATMNQRRERRRQRQSMEVLLGLTAPVCRWSKEETLSQIEETNLSNGEPNIPLQSVFVQTVLGDVVSDFEKTLERTNSLTINSNNVNNSYDTVDIFDRLSSSSCISNNSKYGSLVVLSPENIATEITGDFDDDRIEFVTGLSAIALKNIRKQMALGLERMKELEEKVKLIPVLQVQVSVLKQEKQKLLELLKEQTATLSDENHTYPVYTQQSFHVSTKKNVGVMCAVIMRNVGVGPHYCRTRNISTMTLGLTNHFAKTLKENMAVVSQSSQTKILVSEQGIQTDDLVDNVNHVKKTVQSDLRDSVQPTKINSRTIGISDNTINDNLCSKCSALKRSIGVGPTSYTDDDLSVSLKSLSVSKSFSSKVSKSFNVEDGLNMIIKQRTIGCQSENLSQNKASQCESDITSRYSQCENHLPNGRTVQYTLQNTDTTDVYIKKDASCNTKNIITSNVSSNAPQCSDENDVDCLKCDSNNLRKEVLTGTASRIPRLSYIPINMTEIKKLKSQNTCPQNITISPVSHNNNSEFSGLNSSSNIISNFDETTQSYEGNVMFVEHKQDNTVSSLEYSDLMALEMDDLPTSKCEKRKKKSETNIPEINSPILGGRSCRKKVYPSKEMQAAMKVLNDSLQKFKNTIVRNQVQSALDILQQEWFKVSSTKSANPLSVEDYLDCFEQISSVLLQFIVNMTDDSGNTAMHYAVSHANFDVVSILLDSKVCNINKVNKAGYTSIMLVSLTDLSTPTHCTVVRRLIELADVNIRAKQHGQTALMLAVSHGCLNMVQMLLEAGADINIQDEDGSTALMCAAEHGYINIVKYFLNHPECNSSVVDMDGSTALKIALEAGHKDVAVLLYAHEHSVQGTSSYPLSHLRKFKNVALTTTKNTSLLKGPDEFQ